MINLLSQHRKEIAAICSELQIRSLEVFGSAATGTFDPESSDIDFLADFADPEAPPGLLTRYLTLAQELEALLGTTVEILTPRSIRNPYFRQAVDSQRETIYAA